jgi:hypothetical protein
MQAIGDRQAGVREAALVHRDAATDNAADGDQSETAVGSATSGGACSQGM